MENARFEQRRLALQAVLGDRLNILGCIGGGGMAQVFLGQHKVHGGLLAIKVLSESLAGDPRIVERFLLEAKTAALLTGHPNIVPIFDVEVNAGTGLCYITMQYIVGEDMSSFLQRMGRVHPSMAAMNVAAQVAEALDCAGGSHIVHRDLKPANIRLDRYGRAIVLDFGIAKAATVTDGLTRIGETLGTPFYMCPEQIQELQCDARSDLYSLGCVLFEMLTGKRPFQSCEDSFHSVLSAHLSAPVPSALELDPAIPPVFASVAEKLMRKDPALRFQSPRELLDALHALGIASGPGELRPKPDLDTEAWIAAQTRAPSSPPAAANHQSPAHGTPTPTTGLDAATTSHLEAPDKTQGSGLTALFAGTQSGATEIASVPSPIPEIAPVLNSSSEINSAADQRLVTKHSRRWLGIISAVVIIGAISAVTMILVRRQHAPSAQSAAIQPAIETSASKPLGTLPLTVEDHGTMALVPAGDFVFGDNGQDSPNPKQQLSLPAYYIDQTEVANLEYRRFCVASGEKAPKSCATLGREEYPVTNVTWEDANNFARWAGKRLPSEPEWEKAARGTNGQIYPWGNTPWTDGVPAELKPATYGEDHKSPVGALNMAGNVWEWTTTHFPASDRDYAQAVHSSFSKEWYVMKGGTFLQKNPGIFFRAYMRYGWPKDQGAPSIGFRCVKDSIQ